MKTTLLDDKDYKKTVHIQDGNLRLIVEKSFNPKPTSAQIYGFELNRITSKNAGKLAGLVSCAAMLARALDTTPLVRLRRPIRGTVDDPTT